MALQQEITVTVKGYTVTLSKPLTLFVNDSLDLIITLKQFGIKNPNTPNGQTSEPFDLTDLTVIMYVETANGTDELESTTVVENVITFPIKPIHTGISGKGKMQIVLLDRDGKRLTLPAFDYEVKETINDNNNVPLPADVHALSNETRTIIATSAEQYVELGGGIIELTRVKMTELPKVETVKNTDIVLLETTEGSRTATKENLLKEVNANIKDIVDYQGKSNIDITGKEHDTLESRLRADNTILVDKVNNAKYLPYEGEYIIAANSYLGETKSNVIKGRTLQNLWEYDKQQFINAAEGSKKDNGYMNLVATGAYPTITTFDISMFKPSTLYTIIVETTEYTIDTGLVLSVGNVRSIFTSSTAFITQPGITRHILGTRPNFEGCDWGLQTAISQATTGNVKFRMMIFEGYAMTKTVLVPPYFQGIKSVNEDGENLEQVSCGKNLFDGTYYPIYHDVNNGITENTNCRTAIVRVEPNTTYYIERYNAESTRWSPHQYDRYPEIGTKGSILSGSKGIYTTDSNTKYITLYISNTMEEPPLKVYRSNQIISDYEPYSEHRLPIKMKNLRSLPNGVCDTSDGIRRIEKIIIDGSQDIKLQSINNNNLSNFYVKLPRLGTSVAICDKLLLDDTVIASVIKEGFIISNRDTLYIRLLSNKASTVEQAKLYFKNNPHTFYYELSTPIKEEGNVEQLRTYDGTTNIFTEGSLIEPTISCKVPSNVQQVVMSLRNENEALNNDVNTLQATTEENNLMNIETNVNQEARLTMLELGVI